MCWMADAVMLDAEMLDAGVWMLNAGWLTTV